MAFFGFKPSSSNKPVVNEEYDLFPSLRDESPEWLLELDTDPDKLFEYFAEQPSTKQLLSTNGSLQQSNYESAGRNVRLKERLDEMKKELGQSVVNLEKAREELQTMSLLYDEQHETLSLSSVLLRIECEMAKNEQMMAEYKSVHLSKSKTDYSEYSSGIEELSRHNHLLRFSREWIIENNK